jgi:hypothetical protein
MINFGLITEGLTDQIVIENILSGYFNTYDIQINPLQPERDKDNENKSGYGGWTLVLEYCQSEDFKQAFQFNEYVIIQIDTDVSEDYHISKLDQQGNELSPEELILLVRQKFKNLIGDNFYNHYSERIIFAISVHSIECWFLPLYYKNKPKIAKKITGCLDSLNRELGKTENFTIDEKKPEYYRQISKQYRKQKILRKHYQDNPSLKIFIEEINRRNIVINIDDDDNL